MDLARILGELRAHLGSVNESIAALEQIAAGAGRKRGRPPNWMAEAKSPKGRGRPPGRARKSAPTGS